VALFLFNALFLIIKEHGMKYIKIILMMFLISWTLTDAREYILNESAGWVKGTA